MDFKSLLSKLDSMDAPAATPSAPKLPAAVQLNEDAQLRVLSGRSTYVSEAKKKADDEKKKDQKVDEAFPTVADAKARHEKEKTTGKFDKKDIGTGTQYTRKSSTFDDGGKDSDTKKAEKKNKTAKESIDATAFKGKFDKMVEAEMKTGEKKKSSTGGTIEKIKTGVKHTAGKNYSGKAAEKEVKESAKPDFLDVDKDGDKKEPMKKAAADKGSEKKGSGKGMSDKQAKYFGKKNESKMMPKGKKQPVKESVEQKLSFKQMVQMVQESGGQQQIDAIDRELFNWANRVAASKLGEGIKAELYAGLIYERNGGEFEMYDVLSEDQK